jgi:hypothetical protein
MYDFRFSCPSIVSSSWIREWISFFRCLPLATLWKYLVFASPFKINWLLDRWYHLISSSWSSFAISALDWFLSSISCGNNGRTSAISSRLSMILESHTFFKSPSYASLNRQGVSEQIGFYCSTFWLGTDLQMGAPKQTWPYHKNHPCEAIRVQT